ncbi:MAG: DNA-formamidopyrimidine glycosylase family protein, partial [Planctomycetota bacterium]
MPELPEVERGRRIAESAFAGRTIVECHVADDDIVYEGVPPKEIVAALKGRKVLGVHRRGKHLFFELDERPWPLFHFGMTGAFCVPGEAPLDLA